MPDLVLGPMLRHAGETDATVWVQTDGPCTVEVLGHEARTFCAGGHWFALVVVEALEPATRTPYEVALDGRTVWPLPGEPPSVIPTTDEHAASVVFGSCRVSYPNRPPYTLTKDQDPQGREVDALRALALELRDRPAEAWPSALVLLGDQIYADEVEPRILEAIHRRRSTKEPPGDELADFEEYVRAYEVSWSEPAIRWLFSTVPTAMIFDDHDVIDDWNTSHAWLEQIRRQDWWDERVIGALASYWIFQHLGNLTPAALRADDLWREVQEDGDALDRLRAFAYRADREVDSMRWSYCRDLGPARLVMVDSRAGRVLEPDHRAMVDEAEWDFLTECACTTTAEHLLIGSSLPWLLVPGLHHMEAFNEAVAEGAWGGAAARLMERVRRAVDMEHWAAFNASWRRMTDLVRDIATPGALPDRDPPATIVALGGDVHHAFLAEVGFRRDADAVSRVYQAVCSPFRNPLDARERRVIRTMGGRVAARVFGALARRAGVPDPEIGWRLREPPVFDNVVATMTYSGRDAALRIQRAQPRTNGGAPELDTVFDGDL